MEPHTQTEDSAESRRILEGQLREGYGRVVYSHKTHEKCADILLLRLARLKTAQIILSAMTAAGFVPAIFGSGKSGDIGTWAQVGAVCGMLLSLALLALSTYTKDYDLGTDAQKHRNSANGLWLIREKYQSLLVDVRMKEKPIEVLQKHRDDLIDALSAVHSSAPSTNSKAYKLAQTALKLSEDMTFSEEEIDKLLPKELRRTKEHSATPPGKASNH